MEGDMYRINHANIKEWAANYDGELFDGILCDPPYELGFMGKRWDSSGIAFDTEMWADLFKLLKPGGHLLAFSGSRTYHRMAVAIEDAGFEIRDMIEWVYGCLSEDTEILTVNGWKMLYSVFEGDYVFACDYKNDMRLQLEPVKQKFIYDYDEDAYHIKDTGYYNSELMETDHIVSKNHNVIVSEGWAKDGFSNWDRPQKVFAEVLYENFKKRKELGYKSDFHIPGLNGYIPCTIEKIPYKGKVWCVEVESGAFVARRNGQIFITGNSGFPKSLNIGKAVDKLQGNEREVVGEKPTIHHGTKDNVQKYGFTTEGNITITKGTSEWEGYGTALKPAHEPCVLARKPLEGTVAQNCLKHGTGGLNIDGTRVGKKDGDRTEYGVNGIKRKTGNVWGKQYGAIEFDGTQGRFPSNLILDGSPEVEAVFPQTGGGKYSKQTRQRKGFMLSGSEDNVQEANAPDNYGDSGSASRYFYTAKASRAERSKGLDSTVSIKVQLEICENNTTRQENLAQLQVVTDNSRLKATAESGIGTKSGTEWSMSLFGSQYTEKYPINTKSTTKTTTSSTTTSVILNWLTGLLTNESTLGVNLETENGGNPVESAEYSNTLIATINDQTALALGVNNAQASKRLLISVSDGKNFHSTVKPLALTKYLATLIKPPTGGRLLVPFSGSGSEMIGALQAGWEYVEGVELTEEYIPIAEARIEYWLGQMNKQLEIL